MIICFEGVDACGKETQSKRLAQYLDARRIAFPTYGNEALGVTGPLISEHLKGRWTTIATLPHPAPVDDPILDAHIFQCLQTINRYEMAPVIQALVETGCHVVLDRYWQSAYAFGHADGLDPAWLIRINALLPQPDIAFLLDIDFETSIARRPDHRDRYEKMGKDFYWKVRHNYHSLWRGAADKEWPVMPPSTHKTRWVILDGTKSPDEVFTSILKELSL